VVLVERKGIYVVYDENGKVVIICREKRIAVAYSRRIGYD
tara:strand:- start:412 stop:531 length:120 start_codon:yes stop_codon:yes gene_type:complete